MTYDLQSGSFIGVFLPSLLLDTSKPSSTLGFPGFSILLIWDVTVGGDIGSCDSQN